MQREVRPACTRSGRLETEVRWLAFWGSLRSQGITLLTILHEMGELADVVERAVVLSEGHPIWDGPAADLAPAVHDHARHDEIGHDAAGDCEHSHPHGDTAPAVHHAPALASSGAPLPRRSAP